MNNFKILIIQEIQQQIKSFKFIIMLVLSIFVTLSCIYLQVKEYKERQNSFIEESNIALNQKNSFRVFSEVKVPILIQPNPLSICVKGVDHIAGDKLVISITDLPLFQSLYQIKNPFLKIFNSYDLIDIIIIFLSLAILFTTAETITGDRENGVLKLIFSNKIKKIDFFYAKFLSSLISFSVFLLVIFLIFLLIILFLPFVELTFIDGVKIFVIFIFGLFFISIFVLIAILISLNVTNSTNAVIYGLITWIFITILYPNSIDFIIKTTSSVPSTNQFEASLGSVYKELQDQIESNVNLPSKRNVSLGKTNQCYPGFPDIIGVTQKNVFEAYEKSVRKNIPILFEGQRKLMDIFDNYNDKLIKQRNKSSYFKYVLPGYLLNEFASKVAGTDVRSRKLEVEKQARFYRQNLLEYFESRGAFGLKFFTQMKRGEMKEDYNQYESIIFKKYGWGSDDTYPRIDLNDMPQFKLKNKFHFPLEELLLIIIINMLLVVACFINLQKLK
ncbi:MAG: ABC transporter permease subunit [Chlorobi bacterium]|nr:ABC transporter permease subunit [Chlorobiota bacterium]